MFLQIVAFVFLLRSVVCSNISAINLFSSIIAYLTAAIASTPLSIKLIALSSIDLLKFFIYFVFCYMQIYTLYFNIQLFIQIV